MKNLNLPPHNSDAEKCVLGTILLQGDQLDVALESVAAEDFYHKRHQAIFEVFRDEKKRGRDLDIISVSDTLSRESQLEKVGGTPYLAELTEHAIGNFHFEGLCQIIKDKAIARQIAEMGRNLQERALGQDFEKVADLVEFAQRQAIQLATASGGRNTLYKIESIVRDSMMQIEERFHSKATLLGVSSGWRTLDEMTNGFKPGELIVLAARPSMGKTACSLNLVFNMGVLLKQHLAYFSIEMPKETLVMRMLASGAGIPLDRVMIGRIYDKEWPALINTATAISECALQIDDSNPLSPHELRSRCRRLKLEGKLDCVMVDYLQMMKVKDQRMESREREVAEVSSTLKSIAKELNVPVIALAQLNREAGKRDDKRPGMTDISGSGTIEMDADVIMMLHREEYYDRDNEAIRGQADIIVAKNRNGRTGNVKMRFDAATNRFLELSS